MSSAGRPLCSPRRRCDAALNKSIPARRRRRKPAGTSAQARTLAQRRAVIADWHRAVGWHHELAQDLADCRAALDADSERTAARTERPRVLWAALGDPVHFNSAMAAMERSAVDPLPMLRALCRSGRPDWEPEPLALAAFADAARVALRYRPPLVNRLGDWLQSRYAGLWAAAPHLAPDAWPHVLRRAIVQGTWGPALMGWDETSLEAGPGLTFGIPLERLDLLGVQGSFFADGTELRPPWKLSDGTTTGASPLGPDDYSDLADWDGWAMPPHAAIVLHVSYGGASKDEAHRRLDKLWDAHITPRLRSLPGTRERKNPGNFTMLAGLYRLYAEWCIVRRAKKCDEAVTFFATRLDWDAIPIDIKAMLKPVYDWAEQQVSETIRKDTGKALRTLRPTGPSLAAALADWDVNHD